jgi:hypothetical protein
MAPIFTGFRFGFGSGGGPGAPTLSVSGGIIHTPGNGFRYHVFTYPNVDNFVVSGGPGTLTTQVLIVAGGGGGGGGYYTGGAGGGGVVYGPSIQLSPGIYPVTVGLGGTGSPGSGAASGDGQPSSFNAVIAVGGGGGGSGPTTNDSGHTGGSSGGSSFYVAPPGTVAVTPQPVPPAYTAYGNIGGSSRGPDGGTTVGGGGGGAGGAGSFAQGGPGQPFPQFAGPLIPTLAPVVVRMGPTSDYYGGGGSGAQPGLDRTGGFGGGGTGTTGGTDPAPPPDPLSATGSTHLGGGGGGRGNPNGPGGPGGPGVVIIRYQV